MVKKQIKFIVVITIFLLVISCRKDIYYNLDHSKWFKYAKYDTLIYISNKRIDSYKISEISSGYIDIDKHVYYESLEVSYLGLPDCINCPLSGFSRSTSGVSFFGKLHTSRFDYNNSRKITYYLGDSTIKDVYSLSLSTDDTNYFKVKSIYYSDIYGIIRYDMYNDEVFELQLK